MTDDAEDVRRRAAALASAKAEVQASQEAADALAREELERVEKRVRTCLEALPEIAGRWRARVLPKHPVFLVEFEQVVLGSDQLRWESRAVVYCKKVGVFSLEHAPDQLSSDEVVERVKNIAADWIVNWQGLVLECEAERIAEQAAYEKRLRQRTADDLVGCVGLIIIAAGVLWFLFGRG